MTSYAISFCIEQWAYSSTFKPDAKLQGLCFHFGDHNTLGRYNLSFIISADCSSLRVPYGTNLSFKEKSDIAIESTPE